ncbi:MAG: PAP2 family protein [Planctomycetota bacterium]|nr:MAG: PAP2 family protein [Planctomycetota bacterium]REJ97461.1 MAG: PAP2 family protein [Planctomycetota bacterium]REK20987.1 MAG: PAP2 family protein [Planctomycetota bacterium]REK37231.1 MAG: PAP2 family protein [Planctomycetota bacterium]
MKNSGVLSNFTRFAAWVGKHERSTLAALILLPAGLWLFAEITDEVLEGESQPIDEMILLSMRTRDDVSDPLGPGWMEELGRDFTALGGVGVLTFISVAVIGYLLLQSRYRAALLVLAAIAGGFVVSQTLKGVFDRPRPDLVPHGSIVYTASFPSGHAMMSTATYLSLGALLARMHTQWKQKAYFLVLAALLSLMVGASRVYLGVHWPTDVLAGWTLGACWAVLCWFVALQLQRRGEVEPEISSGPPGASGT